MNRKLVLLCVLTVFLTFTFSMSLRVQVAEASGTIYIRADGSIDPPTAPIQRKGDIYTLTGNITSDTDAIVIERNNMIFNGAGYTVQGTGGGFGILLSETRNVRIRNTQVKGFTYGIFLRAPQFSSSNCTITENNITSNGGGVSLTSYFNILSVNNITKNQGPAVTLFYSHYTKIQGNNISDNWDGLQIESSENCIVSGNKITKNGVGVLLYRSSHNLICNNNFVNNTKQVHDLSWDYPSISPSINFWDNGYPSGGNYWSDYDSIDSDYDGIGDNPYLIDANNQDNYPLMGMFSSFNTSYGYAVDFVSNSSISHVSFNLSPIEVCPPEAILVFNVSGETGTEGFLRIRIPKILINGSYVIRFDDEIITNTTYPKVRELPCANETYEYLYINYTHSEHNIIITGTTTIPEFPSLLILPLFIIATLFTVIIYKRKRTV